MSQYRPTSDEFRHELYDSMKSEASFEEKATQALELGTTYLDVDHGHLAKIDQESGYWEGLVSTDPPNGAFPEGLVLDLGVTYCRRTVQEEATISLHDAPNQGWNDDPAFESQNLHCYHGTPLRLDDAVYGTVCFVSESPREQPFRDDETMFAELIGRLLEHELERRRHETETRKRANLITVLSRVLRHNLRNELTVIRGRVSHMAEQLDAEATDGSAVFRTTDKLLDISEKARKLEKIVSTEFQREETNLGALARTVARDVNTEYPDVSISVDDSEDVLLAVMPSFEGALREIVENAAKHAGESPTVTISIDVSQTAVDIHVSDDGPGLPDHERGVLDEGVETPLVHGRGIGLWMTHWIVSSHNGAITSDITGSGTRLTLTIPRDSADPLSVSSQHERELKRGYDRYRAAFDEAFDAMLMLDDEARIIDANSAARNCGRDARGHFFASETCYTTSPRTVAPSCCSR